MDRRTLMVAGAATLLTAGAWRAADAPKGDPIVVGHSFRLEDGAFPAPTTVNVWLPSSYGEGDRRYPVLYLLDGGVNEDFHHISGLARISGDYGVTREFIVVGIESGATRRRDMTFPSNLADDLKAIPVNGGSGEFRRLIAERVIPWTETRFRTSSERVVMGESLAGLFVLETLLKQPELFTGYIAVDPSLWWNGGSLVRALDLPGWKLTGRQRRLWLTVSSQGSAAEAQAIADGLKDGVDVTFVPMPEETHASIYHPAATRAFRSMFAQPPKG